MQLRLQIYWRKSQVVINYQSKRDKKNLKKMQLRLQKRDKKYDIENILKNYTFLPQKHAFGTNTGLSIHIWSMIG